MYYNMNVSFLVCLFVRQLPHNRAMIVCTYIAWRVKHAAFSETINDSHGICEIFNTYTRLVPWARASNIRQQCKGVGIARKCPGPWFDF